MVRRATLVKLSLLIVESTSLPIAILASVYLLSGYQMLIPDVRLIPEPRRIHTDRFLRILTILLVYLHTVGGAILIAERRLRRREVLKKLIETLAVTMVTILLIALLTIELAL
ncbi:MAG: hypothetical protein RMJ00_04980 [Nitrososphaerota archaeon]|nr:hypothetical protein [Candidatus Bathyarchaeota archaeon]MCX8162134.1 hypothetical protein [Candidatus Bathyarchaeota archaeon]MDW8062035.1 hypothetical protein [Nitrososphaerota archaeon]